MSNITRKMARSGERREYNEFVRDWREDQMRRRAEQFRVDNALGRHTDESVLTSPLPPKPTFNQWQRAKKLFMARRAVEIEATKLESDIDALPDLEWDEPEGERIPDGEKSIYDREPGEEIPTL